MGVWWGRAVKLDTFYMDEKEVTVGQYKRFLSETEHSPPDCSKVARVSSGDDYPMSYV